ncbi:hypothetical protein AKJ08_0588 [Vulgatibacter incomptus]|uniref:Uncharacterized protein n=1 Tax=Vulgatibacter incomptus TaxID=1391653 RepID=A0A0K1P9U4_9BACT|nr:hypothetical protein AKJ08_0588 [Vulgatibacter incomptus]
MDAWPAGWSHENRRRENSRAPGVMATRSRGRNRLSGRRAHDSPQAPPPIRGVGHPPPPRAAPRGSARWPGRAAQSPSRTAAPNAMKAHPLHPVWRTLFARGWSSWSCSS